MGQAAAVHAAIANAVAATSTASSTAASRAPSPPLSPGSSTLLFSAAESLGALSKAALAEGLAVERAASDAGSDPTWPCGDDEDSPYPSFLRREASWPLPLGKKANGAPRQKRPRSVRCGQCDGCLRDDCGTCKNCVDKPKFGGIGQRKQGCVRKLCSQPRVATALPFGDALSEQ